MKWHADLPLACMPALERSFLSVVLRLENYRFDARDAIRLDYASYTLE